MPINGYSLDVANSASNQNNQFTGGSKNGSVISAWRWSLGNANAKGDITNARAALAAQPRDAHATARLLAQVQMAEADAYLAMTDAKMAHRRWRPITAIRLAATDDNPATAPDAAWMPFAFPNPPNSEYPLGHALAGGAADGTELTIPHPF